jgi:hypothetical protein
MRNINFADHLENKLAECLSEKGIDFVHESENKSQGLDFYLPKLNVYIEVKQYHTPRIAKQMTYQNEIIVLQGSKAVDAFIKLITLK